MGSRSKLVFSFTSDLKSGDVFIIADNTHPDPKKVAAFRVSGQIPVRELALEYVGYEATAGAIAFPFNRFEIPRGCAARDFKGPAGFIKIPKALATKARGWFFE